MRVFCIFNKKLGTVVAVARPRAEPSNLTDVVRSWLRDQQAPPEALNDYVNDYVALAYDVMEIDIS
jgi:hypothetical protein